MPPASLSAKPDTRPGPSTARTARRRTRQAGSRGSGGIARRAPGRRFACVTDRPYRLKTRGRRFFQAVGMTVSIASSTVTIPTRRSSSSTTGTASRL